MILRLISSAHNVVNVWCSFVLFQSATWPHEHCAEGHQSPSSHGGLETVRLRCSDALHLPCRSEFVWKTATNSVLERFVWCIFLTTRIFIVYLWWPRRQFRCYILYICIYYYYYTHETYLFINIYHQHNQIMLCTFLMFNIFLWLKYTNNYYYSYINLLQCFNLNILKYLYYRIVRWIQ